MNSRLVISDTFNNFKETGRLRSEKLLLTGNFSDMIAVFLNSTKFLKVLRHGIWSSITAGYHGI